MNGYAVLFLIIWNIVVFVLFGTDKYKAMKHKWRISEKTLITCAFFMGAAGAVVGMNVFHHKTKKTKFRVLIFFALLSNCLVLLLLER